MCSGVVPQQPPTSATPYSLTNAVSAAASSSGLSGYTAPFGPSSGSPALGITDSAIRACLESVRRCSLISAGPVEQFSPMRSTPSASSAVSAAPISEPSSIVPVVSTATCATTGTTAALVGHRPAHAQDGRLGLQEVLAGLDDDRVGPARDEAAAALGVGVAEADERLVAQRRQLRAGADRAEHVPRPVRCRDLVGHLAGQHGALLGELADPFGDVVLGEVGQVRAEGVGLDGVRARLEVGAVDGADHVGPGVVEDLVAALEAREIVEHQIRGLQHRAHRAVGDDDPVAQSLQKTILDAVRLHVSSSRQTGPPR